MAREVFRFFCLVLVQVGHLAPMLSLKHDSVGINCNVMLQVLQHSDLLAFGGPQETLPSEIFHKIPPYLHKNIFTAIL